MNLEQYTLSKMCHNEEAVRFGITRLKTDYFTGRNRKLYTLIKGLYQINKAIDLHVLASQYQGLGEKPEYATEIFHYATSFTDDWENVFSELKESSTKRKVQDDARQILKDSQTLSVQQTASLAIGKATSWVTETEKRYYSGKEIDEMKEEYGEPILTGIPLYDEQIYKHGGNLKGQMKGVICREKHGKTRSECWEVAQNIRMGYKVLYLTLEGTKKDITGNVKQVLRHEWPDYRENLFVVDGTVGIDELEAVTLEAVMCEEIDKVVIDYLQLVHADGSGENERINNATERFRHMMIRHNFHLSALSQSKKESQSTTIPKDAQGNETMPKGWKHVPTVNDAYGSNALIKAASIIMIGFRPNLYEQNISSTGLGSRVMNPQGREDPFHSFYMQTARIRYKPEFLHQWWRFHDGDQGLQNPGWV